MPTEFKGASIEPREVPTWALFELIRLAKKELQERGWAYLRKIGYKPYREKSLDITSVVRSGVNIIHIDAEFEENFMGQEVSFDIPSTHFESVIGKALNA